MSRSTPTDATRRVLVTGNAGAVGSVVAPALAARGHFVRGFDRIEADNVAEHVTGDLTDPDACRRAVDGIDTVVHLAAQPSTRSTWEQLIEPNVIGLYQIFNAARQAGVRYMVAASSVNAVSHVRRQAHALPLRVEDGPGPGNLYGMTKIWAEEMGRFYALNHDMAVLVVRIAWFPRRAREMDRIAQRGAINHYISHNDTARFFTCAVEADLLPRQFEIVFAASRPKTQSAFDLEPARRLLGYEPQDVYPEGSTHEQ